MIGLRISGAVRSSEFSTWLDAFRWIAAYLVVVSHVGGPLLVALRHIPADQRTLPHYFYSFFAGYAHSAVIIFFVMSGLFVGGSLCSEAHRRDPDYKRYLLKRIVRLHIVLIPSLILSYLLCVWGASLAPAIYSEHQLDSVHLSTFACNVVFLQNVACDRFAGNDSLWSLYNEFWYYVIFLFLAVAAIRPASLQRRLSLAGCGLTIGVVLSVFQATNAPLLPYMMIWLIGVGIAYAPQPRYLKGPLSAGVTLVVVVSGFRVTMGAEAMHGTTALSFAADLVTAVLFAKLLVNMKYCKSLPMPYLPSTQHFLAGFSFTVYCVHLPVVYFYSAVMTSAFGLGYEMRPTSASQWTVVYGAIAIAIGSGYLLSLVTEAHTDRLRNAIYRRLSGRR